MIGWMDQVSDNTLVSRAFNLIDILASMTACRLTSKISWPVDKPNASWPDGTDVRI